MPVFFRRDDRRGPIAWAWVESLGRLPDTRADLPDPDPLRTTADLLAALGKPPAPWLEDDPPIATVGRAVLRWIRTVRVAAAVWGFPAWFSNDALPGKVDVFKSALLHRILGDPERGMAPKDPLPEAPPTNFSYPWYELLDEGHARAVNIVRHHHEPLREPDGLSVNGSLFRVVGEPVPGTWIVTYLAGSTVFEVQRDPDPPGSHERIDHAGGNKTVWVPAGVTGTIRVL